MAPLCKRGCSYPTETFCHPPTWRAWWGYTGGGGFVCGSKQLKPSPKLSSLLTFLFSDKKVRPPAGNGSRVFEKCNQNDKLKFEPPTAVLVELTTQGAIDVEPGS